MGDDKDAVLHRRKYHADGTHTQHVEQVSGEESKRRARDAQRARTAPTLLMRILDASKRWYNAAEEVVSVPVVSGFVVLLSTACYVLGPRDPRYLPGDGPQEGPWQWAYGEGKDVVGRVNCTTFWHQDFGAVVEFGHGSGGGITFRSGTEKPIRWVWEDGTIEDMNSLACPDVENVLQRGEGKYGIPKYRLFNRYNKQFWTQGRDGANVTMRNALNPVRVVLHSRGFEFQLREVANISVLDGKMLGQHTVKESDSPFTA